jgi:hypothetical protein
MTRAEQSVEKYLAALPADQQEIALSLREIIRKATPNLEEGMKWNVPCYSGTGNVCAIITNKNHVNQAFYRGSELTDKEGLLEGIGKGMRHVKVRTLRDIRKKALAALIKGAAILDTGSAASS